jgi:hypothetical protein
MGANQVQARKELRQATRAASEARTRQQQLMHSLKQSVCSEYPNGPEGYTYVPERCVTQRRTKASATKQTQIPTIAHKRNQNTSGEIDELNKALTRIPIRPLPRTLKTPHVTQAATNKEVMKEKFIYGLEYKQRHTASFIAFAVEQFMKLKSDVPDIDRRYETICKKYKPFDFTKDADVKMSVMQIALATVSASRV